MKILRYFLVLIMMSFIISICGGCKSSIVNWRYTTPRVLPKPNISIVVSNNNLTQLNTTSTLTITNTGNVALSNISIPTITPANSYINLGSTTCNGSLAIGSSCSYTINYTPVVLSETMNISFGDVRITYSNNKGKVIATNLTSNASVNVSSMREGLVSSNSVLVLNENTSSGNIIFTNTGNNIATVKTVSFMSGSNSNLVIDSNNCSGKSLAPSLSCEVKIKLNSIAVSGSGNGVLQVTYDNHNGLTNAVSSDSNINWVIGRAPNLQATLVSSRLVI